MSRARDLASVAKKRLLLRRSFPFVHAVEKPDPTDPPAAHTVLVKGWLLARPGSPIDEIVVDHGARTELVTVDRPDVGVRWFDHEVVGFQGIVTVDGDAAAPPWSLEVRVGQRTYRCPITVELDERGRATFSTTKATKLERLEPLLRCPRPDADVAVDTSCLGALRREGDSALVCDRCGAPYGRGRAHFDFLSDELRTLGAVDATDAISSWGYDPIASHIIEECSDGLVLDAGSGLKSVYLDNVVNLEIADYPTADVLAIGERLPFATGSFDAVLSLVVLEHVRDPFRCAAEIARVVRPGGRIYVAVPFLQPYHGYPHHYYNMTRPGLEQLFVDDFDIETIDTAAYGLPIFSLTWFLRSYLKGLPPLAARRLGAMKVRDLLREGDSYFGESFVSRLSPEAVEELACSNYLVGTKR